MRFITRCMGLHRYQKGRGAIHFVLFRFGLHLVSRLARSTWLHSDDYAAAGDHPICFASSTLIPEPFMKYAG